jgi:Zn-dependent M28 family amino/carboxypeptidase
MSSGHTALWPMMLLAACRVWAGADASPASVSPATAQQTNAPTATVAQTTAPPAPVSAAAAQWWADIAAIADDSTEGRLTGSAGYLRAADYVIARFKDEGLQPAGTDGYLQPIAFELQLVDQAASRAELVAANGAATPLVLGEEALIAAGGGPRPEAIRAPLVFVGYGLHLPDQGYDDFAGIDLTDKIAVVLSGGPADIPGTVKAAARFARTALLAKLGAAGLIALTTPHQVEIPWARQKLLAGQPGMYLADASLRDTADGFFAASVDPARAERLFAGSGHSFAELCALADASKPLPRFALGPQLQAIIVAHREALSSPNLVAKLAGRDHHLAAQYVAVSAHLDHLGIGAPINGDAIYNGAMDDASGVATVLGIAHRLKMQGRRPRRSILFLIFTAEEKGLWGSHYFALRPSVPKGAVVADLNFDMPLPLWPLTSVLAQGEGESTLGADARVIAYDQHLTLVPDPLPDRNSFIRTDQFSFVREGIPSLAFKFGFRRDTPEFQIEHDWRATRYHAPSDDLGQPGVLKEEAVKLDDFVAALTLRVADADARPEWLPTSVFRKAAPQPAEP